MYIKINNKNAVTHENIRAGRRMKSFRQVLLAFVVFRNKCIIEIDNEMILVIILLLSPQFVFVYNNNSSTVVFCAVFSDRTPSAPIVLLRANNQFKENVPSIKSPLPLLLE